MRLSVLFGRTLRQAPSDTMLLGDQLLARGGFTRSAPTGRAFLPLGWSVIQRMAELVRAELAPLDGQEMIAEVNEPLWMTVAHLSVQAIESYRDLPKLICQLAGARWSICLLHTTEELDAAYGSLLSACEAVFQRCQVSVATIEDNSGGTAHRFVALHPLGESRFVRCEGCGYAAHVDSAAFARVETPQQHADLNPLKRVPTPGANTIAGLCEFLEITPDQTLKAVFYSTEQGEPIFALIRGNLEISEGKLARAVGASTLHPASGAAIAAIGAVAGYASPIGLQVRTSLDETEGVLVVVDLSVQAGRNFVTGANEAGYHVTGVNYPRDFSATLVTDIAEVYEGAPCARCGNRLHLARGISLGCCSHPPSPVPATYLDSHGKAHPLRIGAGELDFGALALAVAEVHHDQHGIIWPPSIAPYTIHLIALGKGYPVGEAAEDLYQAFSDNHLSVLYDDRPNTSPGVKFADADLIGLPMRATVSKRSLEAGGVELKWRRESTTQIAPLNQAIEHIQEMLVQS